MIHTFLFMYSEIINETGIEIISDDYWALYLKTYRDRCK